MTYIELAAHRAAGADVAAAQLQYSQAVEAGRPEAIEMADRALRQAASAMALASRRLSAEDRKTIGARATKPVERFGNVHTPNIGDAELIDVQLRSSQRLATNRRTRGLYCSTCDRDLAIGCRYVLVSGIALCRPCARRYRNTPSNNAPFRPLELTPDALAKRIDDMDVPCRSGLHAEPQTSRDDLLDTASSLEMHRHDKLRRTINDLDFSTAAEQNADPIDEIEDETTPDVPDWTPTYWPRRPFTVKQIAPGVDGLGHYVAGAIVLGDRWSDRLDAYAHLGIPQQCRRLAAPRIGPHLYQRADD